MSVERSLTPDKALIFRITHRDNVPWILDNGLWSVGSGREDPEFVPIGNPSLIEGRHHREIPIPPHGVLSDYIPFYFTPYSPMLLNIVTGHSMPRRPRDELVVLVSSLYDARDAGCAFVFADRHAYLQYLTTENFSNSLDDLADMVPWDLLRTRDFGHDPEQPDKKERYQAEALIHQHLPVSTLKGLVAYNEAVAEALRRQVSDRGLEMPVYARPGWFFQ